MRTENKAAEKTVGVGLTVTMAFAAGARFGVYELTGFRLSP